MTKIDTTLVAPPDGHDSVHGVSATPAKPTDFEDDEYVIYDAKKQHMAYLVEFSLADEPAIVQPLPQAVSKASQRTLIVPVDSYEDGGTSIVPPQQEKEAGEGS